jgi:hypothetical protein
MSKMLCRSNTESGTTILDNGIKVYWTGGASEAVIIHSDGHRERVDAQSDHPILLTPEIAGNEVDEMRSMTEEEEAEWDAVTQ